MSFVNEYRKNLESKGYKIEKSCTEIMQNFGFYSEYCIPEIEKLDFCLPHVHVFGKKHFPSK